MLLSTSILVAAWIGTAACALTQVTNFGSNPANIQMYISVPANIAPNPAIVVALHPCGGSATQWYSGTKLPSYSDKNGFILIYPGTTHMSNCWDVQNPQSLTHGAGGDAGSIVSMVNYTLARYAGDPARVFVMGSSSGGMMTNVLAGSYPDVFAAAASYSGVAHACFAGAPSATPMSPNQTCASGQLQHTPREWGDFVRNSYPGYSGRRPRVQIYHGLADTFVRPQCSYEALKQWSDVLGVSLERNVTGVPSAGYTQMIYGDGTQLQGFFGQGVGHTAPVQEELMLKFFGILS